MQKINSFDNKLYYNYYHKKINLLHHMTLIKIALKHNYENMVLIKQYRYIKCSKIRVWINPMLKEGMWVCLFEEFSWMYFIVILQSICIVWYMFIYCKFCWLTHYNNIILWSCQWNWLADFAPQTSGSIWAAREFYLNTSCTKCRSLEMHDNYSIHFIGLSLVQFD